MDADKKATENDCLVCFSSSTTNRSDLPNHFCECNYPIHMECYKTWKNYTVSRLCIICDANEYQYFEIQKRMIDEKRRSLFGLIICFLMLMYFYNLFSNPQPRFNKPASP